MVNVDVGPGDGTADPAELFHRLYRERWWPMLRVARATTRSQAGTVLLVQGPTSWLGFPVGSDGTVTGVSIGTHDFVAGYEICVGTAR